MRLSGSNRIQTGDMRLSEPDGSRRETCAYQIQTGDMRLSDPDGRHAPIGVKKDSAPIAQSVVYTMA